MERRSFDASSPKREGDRSPEQKGDQSSSAASPGASDHTWLARQAGTDQPQTPPGNKSNANVDTPAGKVKPYVPSPKHSAEKQMAIFNAKLKKVAGESLTPEEEAMSVTRSDKLSHTPPLERTLPSIDDAQSEKQALQDWRKQVALTRSGFSFGRAGIAEETIHSSSRPEASAATQKLNKQAGRARPEDPNKDKAPKKSNNDSE